MTNVHLIVGTTVVIGYVIVLLLNVRLALTGADLRWQRPFSFGVATVLLLQYMLGFSLLGEGKDVDAVHFLLALTAIIPVGLEHGYAGSRRSPRQRGTVAAVANVLTLAIVIAAYLIGQGS